MADLRMLKLSTVKELDHRIERLFDEGVRRTVEDCMDRASDKTTRKVVLTVEIKPQSDQQGDCVALHVRAKIKANVPEHVSPAFQCAPRMGGIAAFNPQSPTDVDQSMMIFGEDKKSEDDEGDDDKQEE